MATGLFRSPTAREFSATDTDLGRTSYVVWINGDSDHYVTSGTTSRARLIRADAMHADRVISAALRCSDCNVILLHIQRGGKRWYTGKAHWATFLRVFTRGTLRMERFSAIENAAAPETLTNLLRFSEALLGRTETHLIYVGHSFLRGNAAQDGANPVPFAYSFPGSTYGVDVFLRSLQDAHLVRRLASITFAACAMADIGLAARLAPYTDTVIAPQFDALESAPLGFSFEAIALEHGQERAATLMASHLMDAFEADSAAREALLEYPVSEIDTHGAKQILETLRRTMRDSLALNAIGAPTLRAIGRDSRRLSARYLALQSRNGVDGMKLRALDESVAFSIDDPDRGDLGRLLRGLAVRDPADGVGPRLQQLETQLRQSVTVFFARPDTGHSGLNVEVSDLTSVARDL